MLALSNPFYQNPEANARHLLQQHMLSDSQRIFQQSVAELLALRSLLTQGHLCLCFPLHSFSLPPNLPANSQLSQSQRPEQHHHPQQSQKIQEPPLTKETKLYVSLKGENQNRVSPLQSEECKLKAEGVEIVVNLREVLPAEIFVGVDERRIGIEVNKVEKEGMYNVWRRYDLPGCVNVEATKCVLTHDAFLHISVPWCIMDL